MRSQTSVVELLLVAVAISASLVMVLVERNSPSSVRIFSVESEETLINFLNYRVPEYNESFSFLIRKCVSFNDSYLFNEGKRVIELLNNNKSFILYINETNKIYNDVPQVCLKKARLSYFHVMADCGEEIVIYGSWRRGEEC